MRARGIAWVVALALVMAVVPQAGAKHVEQHLGPAEPSRDFPNGFLPLLPEDAQAPSTLGDALYPWSSPKVGGWGAEPLRPVTHRPVIFVHGTTEDASFWTANTCCEGTVVNVLQRFIEAGYHPGELWAISYTGARGYFTYNDVNTEEVLGFIEAVRAYTRAPKVDVVAHSLGVTVVRKALFDHANFYARIGRFVAIAGANHGTTTCRGPRTVTGPAGVEHDSVHVSHVCEELEPGSPWLEELNAGPKGRGETPRGPEYLVIYDSVGDHFYLGPDAQSPTLEGACNHDMPGQFHYPVARGEAAVAVYLAFLRDGTLPDDCGESE